MKNRFDDFCEFIMVGSLVLVFAGIVLLWLSGLIIRGIM